MNIRQILTKSISKLKSNIYTNSPARDLEILLTHILKKNKEFIHTNSEKELTSTEITKFNNLLQKRQKGLPIAYIIGYKEFYGLNFFVNKHTLIPRPETELIIDFVKQLKIKKPTTIIDIGTGSGCIIISLAKLLGSNYNYFATDTSKKALSIAKKNSKKHSLSNVKFFLGNLLEPIIENKILIKKSNLIILANLPYLTLSQVKNSPTIQKEPINALVGGNDGLEYYKKLFKNISIINRNKILNSITVIIEMDPSQTKTVIKIIKNFFTKPKIKIKKDFNNLDRLTIIYL